MLKFVLHPSLICCNLTIVASVWKPLRGPLRDWPLALCQLESVDDKDLVPIDEVHVGDILESHQIYYNPEQKWCYLKDQLPSELLIFKAADSKIKGAGTTIAYDEDSMEAQLTCHGSPAWLVLPPRLS